jgi:hypothetical protein
MDLCVANVDKIIMPVMAFLNLLYETSHMYSRSPVYII